MNCPSGGPLVQHSLNMMFEHYLNKKITLEKIVQKMCHNPAILFRVNKRGFIRKNYFADIVIIDPRKNYTVDSNNILYKCGWSPFEGTKFNSQITHTFINGNLVYENGLINEHRDYFDFCGPTFGPVPLLGPFIRWLYSKFVS